MEYAPPRIVCAANRDQHGNMFVSARHFDEQMRKQIVRVNGTLTNSHMEQGFMDQFCKFHTREEAWKIAEAAGQIIRRCGGDDRNGGTLYSENLY